jgi:hypothetical protein
MGVIEDWELKMKRKIFSSQYHKELVEKIVLS